MSEEKALCPNCKEVIPAFTEKEADICPKCGAPFVTASAISALRDQLSGQLMENRPDAVIFQYITPGYYTGVSWEDRDNGVGGIEIKYNFYNNSNKTIKYVWMEIEPVNAVGDVVSSAIGDGSRRTLQATGPIAPHILLAADPDIFMHTNILWYNASIAGVRFLKVEVEYMDGCKVRINGADVKVDPMIGRRAAPVINNTDAVVVSQLQTGHYNGLIWIDTPDMVGGVTVKYNIYNNANKPIKYADLTVLPLNAVGDVVGSSERLRVTGPLLPGKFSGVLHSPLPVWYDASIIDVRVTEIEVEFMDGTKARVAGEHIIVNPTQKNTPESLKIKQKRAMLFLSGIFFTLLTGTFLAGLIGVMQYGYDDDALPIILFFTIGAIVSLIFTIFFFRRFKKLGKKE